MESHAFFVVDGMEYSFRSKDFWEQTSQKYVVFTLKPPRGGGDRSFRASCSEKDPHQII